MAAFKKDKSKDPAFDDFDFDDDMWSDLDTKDMDFEGDFLNEGDDDDGDKSRSPILRHIRSVGADLHKAGTAAAGGAAVGIQQKVEKEFPEVGRSIDFALRGAGDIVRMKDDILKEIRPTALEAKLTMRKFLQLGDNILPNVGIFKKIDQYLESPETDEKTPKVDIRAQREQQISENLDSLFKINLEENVLERKQAAVERLIDKRETRANHAELTGLVGDIRLQAMFHTSFLKSSTTAYMKKSLELQYRQLYVQQDILEANKLHTKSMEERLDAIKHNTSLPETQKIRKMELFAQQRKERIFNTLNDYVSDFFSHVTNKIKEDYVKPGIELAQSMIGQLDTVADMLQMEQEMGEGMSTKSIALAQGGGFAGKILGGRLGRSIINAIPKNIRETLNKVGAGGPKGLMLFLNRVAKGEHDFGDKWDSSYAKALEWITELMPTMQEGLGVHTNVGYEESDKPGAITNKFILTVEQIIPQYLAQQTKWLEMLATGNRNVQERYYNWKSMKFETRSEMNERLVTDIMGRKEQQTDTFKHVADSMREAIGNVSFNREDVINPITGTFAEREQKRQTRINELRTLYDDISVDLNIGLMNVARAKIGNRLPIEGIKAVANGESITYNDHAYFTKHFFKDIDDPQNFARKMLRVFTDVDGHPRQDLIAQVTVTINKFIEVTEQQEAEVRKALRFYGGGSDVLTTNEKGKIIVDQKVLDESYKHIKREDISSTSSYSSWWDPDEEKDILEKLADKIEVAKEIFNDLRIGEKLKEFGADTIRSLAKTFKIREEALEDIYEKITGTLEAWGERGRKVRNKIAQRYGKVKEFIIVKAAKQLQKIPKIKPLYDLVFTEEGLLREEPINPNDLDSIVKYLRAWNLIDKLLYSDEFHWSILRDILWAQPLVGEYFDNLIKQAQKKKEIDAIRGFRAERAEILTSDKIQLGGATIEKNEEGKFVVNTPKELVNLLRNRPDVKLDDINIDGILNSQKITQQIEYREIEDNPHKERMEELRNQLSGEISIENPFMQTGFVTPYLLERIVGYRLDRMILLLGGTKEMTGPMPVKADLERELRQLKKASTEKVVTEHVETPYAGKNIRDILKDEIGAARLYRLENRGVRGQKYRDQLLRQHEKDKIDQAFSYTTGFGSEAGYTMNLRRQYIVEDEHALKQLLAKHPEINIQTQIDWANWARTERKYDPEITTRALKKRITDLDFVKEHVKKFNANRNRKATGGIIDAITGQDAGVYDKPSLIANGNALVGEHGVESVVPHNRTDDAIRAYLEAKAYHEGKTYARGGTVDKESGGKKESTISDEQIRKFKDGRELLDAFKDSLSSFFNKKNLGDIYDAAKQVDSPERDARKALEVETASKMKFETPMSVFQDMRDLLYHIALNTGSDSETLEAALEESRKGRRLTNMINYGKLKMFGIYADTRGIVGRTVDAAGSGIKKIASTGFSLAKWSVRQGINTPKSFLLNKADDVYVTNPHGDDLPPREEDLRISKAQFKAGVFFDREQREPVKSVADINKPVYDAEGNPLIDEADLHRGLVNRKGRPIRELGTVIGRTGHHLAAGTIDKAKDFGSWAWDKGKKIGVVDKAVSAVKTAANIAKAPLRSIYALAVKFVDIYVPSKLPPHDPLVTATAQKEGLVEFTNGEPIKNSWSINRPVRYTDVDENGERRGQIAITAQDIDEGLCDHKGKPLSQLGRGVGAAGRKVLDWALGKVSRVGGLVSLGLSAAKSAFKFLTKKKDPYIDVYVRGRMPHSPVLLGRDIRAGKYVYADGTPVTSAYGITKAVYDSDKMNILVTEEDIEKGLVDIKGNRLSKWAGRSIAFKLATAGFVAGKWALGKGIKAVKGLARTVANKLGYDAISGREFLERLRVRWGDFKDGFGFGISRKDLEEVVGERLDKIIDIISAQYDLFRRVHPAAAAGDRDGDGIRDGSYEDQQKKKKEKEKGKKEAEGKGNKDDKQVPTGGILGSLAAALGLKGAKKDEDDDEGFGLLEYLGLKDAYNSFKDSKIGKKVAGSKLGKAASKIGAGASAVGGFLGSGAKAILSGPWSALKWGGKTAFQAAKLGAKGVGMGLKGAGTALFGTSKAAVANAAAGTGAKALAAKAAQKGALGLAKSGIAAGLNVAKTLGSRAAMSVLGFVPGVGQVMWAATLAFVGYKAAKSIFGDSDRVKTFQKLRAAAYGIDQNKYDDIKKLEKDMLNILLKKREPLSDKEILNYAKDFGLITEKTSGFVKLLPFISQVIDYKNREKIKESQSTAAERLKYFKTWILERVGPMVSFFYTYMARALKKNPGDTISFNDVDTLANSELFQQCIHDMTNMARTIVNTPVKGIDGIRVGQLAPTERAYKDFLIKTDVTKRRKEGKKTITDIFFDKKRELYVFSALGQEYTDPDKEKLQKKWFEVKKLVEEDDKKTAEKDLAKTAAATPKGDTATEIEKKADELAKKNDSTLKTVSATMAAASLPEVAKKSMSKAVDISADIVDKTKETKLGKALGASGDNLQGAFKFAPIASMAAAISWIFGPSKEEKAQSFGVRKIALYGIEEKNARLVNKLEKLTIEAIRTNEDPLDEDTVRKWMRIFGLGGRGWFGGKVTPERIDYFKDWYNFRFKPVVHKAYSTIIDLMAKDKSNGDAITRFAGQLITLDYLDKIKDPVKKKEAIDTLVRACEALLNNPVGQGEAAKYLKVKDLVMSSEGYDAYLALKKEAMYAQDKERFKYEPTPVEKDPENNQYFFYWQKKRMSYATQNEADEAYRAYIAYGATLKKLEEAQTVKNNLEGRTSPTASDIELQTQRLEKQIQEREEREFNAKVAAATGANTKIGSTSSAVATITPKKETTSGFVMAAPSANISTPAKPATPATPAASAAKPINVGSKMSAKDLEEQISARAGKSGGKSTTSTPTATTPAAASSGSTFVPTGTGNIDTSSLTFKRGVDYKNLHPALTERFSAMAKEYEEKYGKKILVKGGKRSLEDQARLYNESGPKLAAKPHRLAPHIVGLALDADDSAMNKSDDTGLMAKHGLWRPLKNGLGRTAKEPWHVEVIGSRDPRSGSRITDATVEKINKEYGASTSPDVSEGKLDPSDPATKDTSAEGIDSKSLADQQKEVEDKEKETKKTELGAPGGGPSTAEMASTPAPTVSVGSGSSESVSTETTSTASAAPSTGGESISVSAPAAPSGGGSLASTGTGIVEISANIPINTNLGAPGGNAQKDVNLPDMSSVKATNIPDGGASDLGEYVKQFESGKRGPSAIAWDRTGGTSYGTYQLSAKHESIDEFLKWTPKHGGDFGKQVSAYMAKSRPYETGSKQGAAPNTWKQLAQVDDGKALNKLEHGYIKTKFYDRALKGIEGNAKELINKDRGLQEALWSTAVQHGPGGAKGIFNKTYKEGITAEEWLKAIYAERGTRFPKSTAAVRQSVQNRFKKELPIVLGLSGQNPADTESTGDTGGGSGGEAINAEVAATTPASDFSDVKASDSAGVSGGTLTEAMTGGADASTGGATSTPSPSASESTASSTSGTDQGSTSGSGISGAISSAVSNLSTGATTAGIMGAAAGASVGGMSFGGTSGGGFGGGGSTDGADGSGAGMTYTPTGNVDTSALKIQSGVDYMNLHPALTERFAAMAKEYEAQFGQKITVTSGKRSLQKQAELYKKYGPGRAAKPNPLSPHISGLALDANSSEMNKADSSGLMEKFGLWRPLKNGLGRCQPEAWHVEIAGSRDKSMKITEGTIAAINQQHNASTTANAGNDEPKANDPSVQDTSSDGTQSESLAEQKKEAEQTGTQTALGTPGGGPNIDLNSSTTSTGGESSGAVATGGESGGGASTGGGGSIATAETASAPSAGAMSGGGMGMGGGDTITTTPASTGGPIVSTATPSQTGTVNGAIDNTPVVQELKLVAEILTGMRTDMQGYFGNKTGNEQNTAAASVATTGSNIDNSSLQAALEQALMAVVQKTGFTGQTGAGGSTSSGGGSSIYGQSQTLTSPIDMSKKAAVAM